MKVYNYLEYNCLTKLEKYRYNHKLKKIIPSGISMEAFYSLPFEPEMINRFFKIPNYYKFETLSVPSLNSYIVTIMDYQYLLTSTKFKNKTRRECYDVFILNDFIRDCQRAYIHLEWKEQIFTNVLKLPRLIEIYIQRIKRIGRKQK